MTTNTYSMSFTTGALLYNETITVAQLYHQLASWDAVRERVLADNRLQMRTTNAAKRIFQETASRLRQITPAQLDYLLTADRREQNYLLWLAFCQRYRFIYDFAVDVIREKFLRLDLDLTYDDYDIFFRNKAEWHPEVARVAETTRKKQRQFLFKILREAELLSDDGQILPVFLSPHLLHLITEDNPAHLAIFATQTV
jgi:hypothetical protein